LLRIPGEVPVAEEPSLAVLPFLNLSGDAEQEYFADGMVEEIITALSRIRWLFVTARNSTFAYKNQNVDVKQVGRELGVRYVLEGSVRKSANRGAHHRAAGEIGPNRSRCSQLVPFSRPEPLVGMGALLTAGFLLLAWVFKLGFSLISSR